MSTHLVVTQKPSGGQALVQAELQTYVSNIIIPNVDCEASVYVGAAVVTNSSGVARNALADSLANSNVIGIVESKESAVKCTIRVVSLTGSIFLGLDVTKEYYLSDTVPGGLQILPPTDSGTVRLKLGQPFDETRFIIMKGERMVRA